MPSLGKTLSQTIRKLTDTIEALPDGANRNKLIKQQKALAAELVTLIDENVEADTEEYRNATAALEAANKSLAKARVSIRKIAETIDAVAEAVEAVAELAASL
jgi:methyl-accepting chemotaxis protein